MKKPSLFRERQAAGWPAGRFGGRLTADGRKELVDDGSAGGGRGRGGRCRYGERASERRLLGRACGGGGGGGRGGGRGAGSLRGGGWGLGREGSGGSDCLSSAKPR